MLDTVMGPLEALVGTVAVSDVSVVGGANEALAPLNFTAVAVVKCRPVMITVLLILPDAGEKPAMNGPGPTTVNVLVLVNEPFGVVTVISPLVAPAGTYAVI